MLKYKELRKRTNNIYLTDIREKVESIKSENIRYHEEIVALKAEKDSLLMRPSSAPAIQALEDEITDVKDRIASLENQRRILEREIAVMNERLPTLPDYDNLNLKRVRAVEDLDVAHNLPKTLRAAHQKKQRDLVDARIVLEQKLSSFSSQASGFNSNLNLLIGELNRLINRCKQREEILQRFVDEYKVAILDLELC